MAARLKSLAIGLTIMLSAASPASALDSCSCRNLESLQQELANAVYETGFFESLSQQLDVIEKKQIEINKDPTNPEFGQAGAAGVGRMRARTSWPSSSSRRIRR